LTKLLLEASFEGFEPFGGKVLVSRQIKVRGGASFSAFGAVGQQVLAGLPYLTGESALKGLEDSELLRLALSPLQRPPR